MEFTEFGTLIKQLRKEKRMTRANLCELIGVSPTTLRNWETGVFSPRKAHIAKLSKSLNVSEETLRNALNSTINPPIKDNAFLKATALTSELAALLAGNQLTDRDKDTIMYTLQRTYVANKDIEFPDDDADIWEDFSPSSQN